MLRGEIKQRTRLEVSVPFVQLMAKQREIEGLDIHVKPMVTMFGRRLSVSVSTSSSRWTNDQDSRSAAMFRSFRTAPKYRRAAN